MPSTFIVRRALALALCCTGSVHAATDADPGSFSAWFVRGTNHLALEQNDLAAMCFTACVALRPDFAPVMLIAALCIAALPGANVNAPLRILHTL